MKFTIEKGIPVPPRGRRAVYPFGELRLGDSFIVPADLLMHARTALSSYVRDRGLQGAFATRKQADGSMRIWRVGGEMRAIDEGQDEVMHAWLIECMEVGAGVGRETVADLFASWLSWAKANRHPPGGINAFSADLQRLGYHPWRNAHARGFEGIKLKGG